MSNKITQNPPTQQKDAITDSYTCHFSEVYAAELDYIRERRKKMGLETLHEPPSTDDISLQKKHSPTPQTGLVGLALSGGGIRSATFNLGLLQTLAEKGVLACCDYLSTVSGGGYIGSCLSSLLAKEPNASTAKEKFPLRSEREGEDERKEVAYLRAARNYLGLGGGVCSVDNCHALGMTLSGICLINVFPLAMLFLLTLLLYVLEDYFYFYGDIGIKQIVIFMAIMAFLAVIVIRWWQQLLPWTSSTKKVRQRYHQAIARWTKVAVLLLVFAFFVNLIYFEAWQWFMSHKHDSIKTEFFKLFLPFLLVSFLIIIGGTTGLYGSKIRKKGLKITISIALVVFFLTLPIALLSTMYQLEYKGRLFQLLSLGENRDMDMTWHGMMTNENPSKMVTLKEMIIWVTTFPEKTASDENTMLLYLKHEGIWQCFTKAYLDEEGYFIKVLDQFQRYLKKDEPCEFLGQNNQVDYLNNMIKNVSRLKEEKENSFDVSKHIIFWMSIMIIGILFVISLFTNLNRISQHYFYCNRLSHTFLIRREKETIEGNTKLLLKDLHEHHNGPYHLVNATLNIPSSDFTSLRGRGADLFIFSKFYCGSESTGYRKTAFYQKGNSTLATAMAVSGAAVSPEMGTVEHGSFIAFMATLLNLRLNLWVLNPRRKKSPLLTFWPGFLLKELRRRGTEKGQLLNLSDGGHYENLGVYALLKRRCRVIIASDVGADPNFQMTDLANLERKARIDFGIDIKFKNLHHLRPNLEGYSQTQFAEGTIYYPEGEKGTLIYIKAALTGTEPEDILAYQREETTFPHQTTADQFFDEEQFESYRKLGRWIGEEVFKDHSQINLFQEGPVLNKDRAEAL